MNTEPKLFDISPLQMRFTQVLLGVLGASSLSLLFFYPDQSQYDSVMAAVIAVVFLATVFLLPKVDKLYAWALAKDAERALRSKPGPGR